VLLFAAGSAIRADVIYTNFGSGNSYSTGAGLIVTNDGSAWSSVAVGFVPSADYNLSSIEFVATDLIPADAGATLGIFMDNGGQPGGAPVELFTLAGSLGQFGNAVPVMTVTSLLQPLLQANTLYWIGMQGPAGSFIIWNQNSTNAAGYSMADGSGNWTASDQAQGVVEIDGTLAPVVLDPLLGPTPAQNQDSGPAIPEPSDVWLITGGLAAVAFFVRRTVRQRSDTIALHRPETTIP
jgi:hypothetical protein